MTTLAIPAIDRDMDKRASNGGKPAQWTDADSNLSATAAWECAGVFPDLNDPLIRALPIRSLALACAIIERHSKLGAASSRKHLVPPN